MLHRIPQLKLSADLLQNQNTHLYCTVRYSTVNRYLRHCRSSSCSTTAGSTASVSTTTTTAATTITNASGSSRTSSSCSSIRGTITADSSGAGGNGGGRGGGCGGPGTAGSGSRGPWLTLHGALCSFHLWPPALLNGSPVPSRKKQKTWWMYGSLFLPLIQKLELVIFLDNQLNNY